MPGRRSLLLPLLVLAVSLGLTAWAWAAAKAEARRNIQKEFDLQVDDAQQRIERRMTTYAQVLRDTHGLFITTPVGRKDFKRFIGALRLDRNFPGIQAVGFQLVVPGPDLEGHIASVRREGLADYTVRPEGRRPLHAPVVYIEPFTGRNVRVLGFDPLSDPMRREALERARDFDEVTVSGKVQLVQENAEGAQPGFLMYLPVFNLGPSQQDRGFLTAHERRSNVRGWVYAAFRMNDMMEGALSRSSLEVDLSIFDGARVSPEARLFGRDPGAQDRPAGDPLRRERVLEIGHHPWTLVFQARPGFGAGPWSRNANTTLLAGLLASLLMPLLTLFLVGSRDRATALAEDRESRFQTLFEHSPVAVWEEDFSAVQRRFAELRAAGVVDLRGHLDANPGELLDLAGRIRVQAVNGAGLRLVGAATSEDLVRQLQVYFIEDSLPVLREELATLFEGRPAFESQIAVNDLAGRRRELELKLSVVPGHEADLSKVLVSFVDITESKRAEEALRHSRDLMRYLIEHTSSAVAVHDRDMKYIYVSQRYLDDYAPGAGDVIGRGHYEVIPEIPQKWREVHQKALRGEVSSSEADPYVTAGGSTEWTRWECRPWYEAGGAIGGIVVYTEVITARVHAEEERNRLQAQLLQTQKMESLGVLASGVAHDMNNVLGAILGLASASREAHPDGGPTRRAFDTIVKAAERGGKMIRSLLSFARQASIEVREQRMNDLIVEEVHLLERTVPANIRVALDLEPDLRPIQGDASTLTHALMNLCVNAADAMPGGGTLTLRTRNLQDGRIEVLVEDTGEGMPKAVLDRAIEPFFTTKAQGKGTGLGLSMVYSTVKAHGGELDLESRPGQGTSVRLRLPAGTAPESDAVAPAAASPGPTGAPLSVLVIDDDELVQASMAMLLEALGHGVTAASSGEEGLARLEAGLRPDLVVLDMNMPGLGGGGTLPRLRALLPGLPVLLATGRVDEAAVALIGSDPATTLLPKPFTLRDLQARIGRALTAP